MLLDISFGYLLGKYFAINFFDQNFYVLIICLGIIFSLLPDLDFVKIKYHRGVLHTPAFYIFLSLGIFYFDSYIAYMFLAGTMFHLIHDLFVLGRGVMIFYPFSKKRLKIFPDNGQDGYLDKKILWWDESKDKLYSSDIKEDIKEEVSKYNFNSASNNSNNENLRLDNPDWISTWYFRPNLFLFIETGLAILLFLLSFLLK